MCIRNDSLAKQNFSRVSRGKALPVRHSQNTIVSILSWLFAFQLCARHMHHFAGCLLASYPRKHFSLQFALSLHTLFLSHTQPLQINPTCNTGYKRLNRITIKFGTELKPTKHIVVNYNFKISPFSYSMTKPLKKTLDLNMSLGIVVNLI